ncbi:tetratricopeptide repeat protein [Acidobacteriota bacterium]
MKRFFLLFCVMSLSGLLFLSGLTGGGTERKGRECMDYMAYGEAIRHFKEALSKNSEKKGVRVDLAFSLFKNGQQDEATQVLHQELALHANNINAYALLGYILFFHDKQEEALKVCQEFDILYTKVISREICQKWPAPHKSIYREAYWTRHHSKHSQSPLQTLMAKIYAWKKFYAPSGKEEEEGFNHILRKLRKNHPNLGLPHFILGLLQKKSGDLRESENNFKLALLNGYDRTECYSQLVDLQFLKEDWTEGMQLAKKTIETLGPLSKIFFLMGYASNLLNDGETAKLYFEEAINREPYLAEARKNLAKIYLCESRFEKSTKLLKQVIKLAPLDMEARLLRNRSLSRNPGLTKEGRPVLSKEILDKVGLKYTYVFHSDVKNVLTSINQRGLTMLRSGHVDRTIAILRAFLEIYDFNSVLHYNLGLLCLDQDNLKEALTAAWRAAELDPDYLEPRDLAANVLYRIGDYERSLLAYDEVVRLDPNDAQGYYNIGLIHEAMGKFDESERSWHIAIQKDKKAKKANLNNGSESEALVHSLTVETPPVSFDAHKSLGSLYVRLGKKDKALREFKSALEFVPNDSGCYYYLGKIHHELGEMRKAISNLEKCVYLGTKWEKKAQKLLGKIKKNSE